VLRRLGAVAVAAIACAGLSGCGGDDAGRAPATAPVVDELLRSVLQEAPADVREGVRFATSELALGPPPPGERDDVVVVASPVFPAWGAEQRVSDVRAVATDEVVLLRRATDPDSWKGLPRRASIPRVERPGTAAEAVDGAFRLLASRDTPTRGEDIRGFRSSPVASAAEAARLVREGKDDAALVMRSSVTRPPPGVRVVELPDDVAEDLILQIGTVRRSAAGERLRRWLTGDEGARRLLAAGFGAPDPVRAGGR
jgi:hypothetical protein